MTISKTKKEKISAIIVDDEQPSRAALSNYMNEFCPELLVVAQCDSINSAWKAINELKPQLVLLDIEMPNGNGFDLLRMFNPIPFKVIFITAFSQYAVDAFRFAAVDYLMKPVKIAELIEAVNKVKNSIGNHNSIDVVLKLLESYSPHSSKENSLIISGAKGFTLVKKSDIIMLKADGYCTTLYLTGKSNITSTRNLKYYEDILDPIQFMRIHHSYLINFEHVTGYTHQEEILLTHDLRCPLSKSHKQGFLSYYKIIKHKNG
jgi:two-component system, LytTR family, response regulator